MNIADKYYWITQHPKYVPFGRDAVIEITPHMVCPETRHIEELEIMNTKLEFWVELAIPITDEYHGDCEMHDWELDCGGDTWEEAVENLYQRVLKKYGDYTEADLDAHREEAMKNVDMSIFDFPKFDYKYEDRTALDEYEIEKLTRQIEHLEKLIPAMQSKVQELEDEINNKISMEKSLLREQLQQKIVLTRFQIRDKKLSLKLDYDVEMYGLSDEFKRDGIPREYL